MIALSVLAIVVLAVAFYLTYLFSWGAGYDAAVRGSMNGSALWRHVSLKMLAEANTQETAPSSIESYAEIKRAVDVASSGMWANRPEAAKDIVAHAPTEKIQLGASKSRT